MPIITTANLAAYLEDSSIETSARAALLVEMTDGLIAEKWANPVDPVPTSVLALAYTVAARAWRNRPGHGPVESVTRSFDDSSRTERYAVPVGDANGHDVYLTDAELALLNGDPQRRKRVGSIGLNIPAQPRAGSFWRDH